MKTPREVFEHVRSHLLTQERRAWDDQIGGCVYRSPEGLRCAVGCLIPDEWYDPAMETASVANLEIADGRWSAGPNRRPKLVALATALNGAGIPATTEMQELLNNLQDIHDNEIPGDDWFGSLNHIAYANGWQEWEPEHD